MKNKCGGCGIYSHTDI